MRSACGDQEDRRKEVGKNSFEGFLHFWCDVDGDAVVEAEGFKKDDGAGDDGGGTGAGHAAEGDIWETLSLSLWMMLNAQGGGRCRKRRSRR